MKLIKKEYPAVLALIVSSLSVPAMAQDAKNSQDVKDARLESQILTTYQLSPYLRYDDITVTVESGKATISGRVESDANKELATEIAQGVKGINKVDNSMITEDNYQQPVRKGESSYAEIIDDASITAAVKSKLIWSRYVDSSTTKKGMVTLTGTAENKAAVDLAENLAMTTRGVMSVDNKLTVLANPDKKSKPGTAMADGWITTKVKSTFMYSNNVDSSDIAVNTNKGVVTLNGLVDSGSEKALAVQLAENVKGVQSVDAGGLTFK
ncbi:MAG: BON domain-containing protein [Gammaproteobacteria bacterium]|nr:BON domain-containing protein [Gammaproteobacteria bacterium]